MARHCKICGGRLRTGIKYCYKCRSLGRSGKRDGKVAEGDNLLPILFVIFFFIGLIVLVISLINKGANQEQVVNLPKDENQFQLFCKNLTEGYDNLQKIIYFENKSLAEKYYLSQGFANNTQSYIISICRLNQLGNNEKTIIYYRSVWWRSPLVCTEKGLLNCPAQEDVNDKSQVHSLR